VVVLVKSLGKVCRPSHPANIVYQNTSESSTVQYYVAQLAYKNRLVNLPTIIAMKHNILPSGVDVRTVCLAPNVFSMLWSVKQFNVNVLCCDLFCVFSSCGILFCIYALDYQLINSVVHYNSFLY
jgi:hypothetical protein